MPAPTPPPARGVELHYRFGATAQSSSQIEHPLFDLLSAVADAGSIQGAARAMGMSAPGRSQALIPEHAVRRVVQ
jgi:hypothetical protein